MFLRKKRFQWISKFEGGEGLTGTGSKQVCYFRILGNKTGAVQTGVGSYLKTTVWIEGQG